jgi:hypothetical protein
MGVSPPDVDDGRCRTSEGYLSSSGFLRVVCRDQLSHFGKVIVRILMHCTNVSVVERE